MRHAAVKTFDNYRESWFNVPKQSALGEGTKEEYKRVALKVFFYRRPDRHKIPVKIKKFW